MLVEHAADVYTFVQYARAASWATHRQLTAATAEAAIATAMDTRAQIMLPHFGMEQQNRACDGAQIRIWVESPERRWHMAATSIIERTLAEAPINVSDDGLFQHVSLESITSAWSGYLQTLMTRYGYRSEDLPTRESLPYQIAYAAYKGHGIPWTIGSDGLTRSLPNHPLRSPEETLRTVSSETRVAALCQAWAVLPPQHAANPTHHPCLVYLSLLGHQKELQAIKASIVDAKRGEVFLPLAGRGYQTLAARRRQGKGVFHSFTHYLPHSEYSHMVLQLREELEPVMGCDFPHVVAADGHPDLPRLFRQLDIALRLPVAEAWMPQLWELGLKLGLITTVESYGCTTYWVNASNDARWAQVIAACNGNPDAVMECFGELEQIAAVEEIASEGDDDGDSDGDNA